MNNLADFKIHRRICSHCLYFKLWSKGH